MLNIDELGFTDLVAFSKMVKAERDALNSRLTLADEANDLMRDALDHIAKTCSQSRTQTLRIRWIKDRANLALQGKPYVQSEHALPRSAGDSAVMAQMKAKQLQFEVDQLKAKVTDCRGLLAKLHQNQQSNIVAFIAEIRRVLSSLQE